MYRGNQMSRGVVCEINFSSQCHYIGYNFKKYRGCPNDEARSLRLYDTDAGTKITIYDSPSFSRRDDYVTITVLQNIGQLDISTLERSFQNEYVKVRFSRKNGLDGKVSALQIQNPGCAGK